jgi:hypothetical protein
MIHRNLAAITLSLVVVASVSATDFYADPQNGKATNDGSEARPWKSLQGVLDDGLIESQEWNALPYNDSRTLVPTHQGAPVKAGDTIWLQTGDYGDLVIQGLYNSRVITVAAQKGHAPRFHSIKLQSGSNWRFKGLQVSGEHHPGERQPGKRPQTLIAVESHGFRGPVHDVWVEECVLSSAENSSAWSAEDWNKRASNGIQADGTRITLRNNHLKNVNFGLSVSASHSLIDHNTVENFSGDGMRGLGDHCVFQYNLVKNCYDVNDNHDDGFQSWSRGPKGESGRGTVKGIVLRGNTIINYEDPAQPHRGPLQGIGCFDGMFEDWVIENNVIIVDHWHGLTLLGATNCRIVNNTVVDISPGRPGPPRISIGHHKNGTASTGCTVVNNLTTDLKTVPGVTVGHNLIVTDAASVFTDFRRNDLSLKKGSPAIDAGALELAPKVDIIGTHRPQGAAVDIGAYEFIEK